MAEALLEVGAFAVMIPRTLFSVRGRSYRDL